MNTLMAKASSGFAERLRQLRQTAGLTQAEVAERAGLSMNGYTKLEYGTREPAWLTVLALAKALNVKPNDFIGVDTDTQPTSEKPRRGRSRKSADDAQPGE